MFKIYLTCPIYLDNDPLKVIKVDEIHINHICVYFWFKDKEGWKHRINIFRWKLEKIEVWDINQENIIYVIPKDILEKRNIGSDL